MELAFKVILLVIMLLSLMGTITDDKDKVSSYAGICIASILAVASMVVWL